MELLQELHGSSAAALQALQTCKAQCWALGADAEALRQLGVHNVQTPTEVCAAGSALLHVSTAMSMGSQYAVTCSYSSVHVGLHRADIACPRLEIK